MKRILSSIFFFFILLVSSSQPLYQEKYRPQFHFSPPLHWMNDPNGLVYLNGEYHLFYQYNPMGIRWGHMSWGHAVSRDLVTWRHLPLAIPEEKGIMIFSGGCVVDRFNSAGFAESDAQVPMVAIYTASSDKNIQSQHLAYSLDYGRSWKKYDQNPVLDLGLGDFRDPQVIWYEPEKKWVMTVALPLEKKVLFFSSKNLRKWNLMSSFGPAGDTSGIWECPDLMKVPVKNAAGQTKWLLMLSPAPYMQYFIGEFDGRVFKSDNPVGRIYRPDYGPDYYAAIFYKNLPDSIDPITMGWANNWNYAQDIPTMPWRSAMSLPRTIAVEKTENEWRLIQEPVKSLNQLGLPAVTEITGKHLDSGLRIPVNRDQFEFHLLAGKLNGGALKIELASNDKKIILLGFNASSGKLRLERKKEGNFAFSKSFEELSRYECSLPFSNDQLELRLYVDHSIVEVFGGQGEAVMTMQYFPIGNTTHITISCEPGTCTIDELTLTPMKSAWK